jgi:hypothetical protein
MNEIIVSTIFVLICLLPLFIIGIVQYRSTKPVGFWSGKEPPKSEDITDVRAYNHKHGIMWIVYAAGFLACFISGGFISEYAAAAAAGIECIGGLGLMILYHNRLDRKYLK